MLARNGSIIVVRLRRLLGHVQFPPVQTVAAAAGEVLAAAGGIEARLALLPVARGLLALALLGEVVGQAPTAEADALAGVDVTPTAPAGAGETGSDGAERHDSTLRKVDWWHLRRYRRA
jgi:hypothetical protein